MIVPRAIIDALASGDARLAQSIKILHVRGGLFGSQ